MLEIVEILVHVLGGLVRLAAAALGLRLSRMFSWLWERYLQCVDWMAGLGPSKKIKQ